MLGVSDKLKNDICRKYVQKTSNLYEKPKAQKTAQKDRHFRDNEKSIAHNHIKRRRTSLMFRQIQITRIFDSTKCLSGSKCPGTQTAGGAENSSKKLRKTIWHYYLVFITYSVKQQFDSLEDDENK